VDMLGIHLYIFLILQFQLSPNLRTEEACGFRHRGKFTVFPN
jgi:hypothetical protein